MATPTIVTEQGLPASYEAPSHLRGHYLSWGAIVAGAICAAAISLVLFAFGSAIGLSAISPWPHSGLPSIVLVIIGALWVALVQIVGFASGGYVAGRVRNSWSSVEPHERRFRDGMHGLVVWALGLLLGSAFAVSAAGGLLHSGMQAGATLAAGGAAGLASHPASMPGVSYMPADYAIDYLMRPAPATAAIATPTPVPATSQAPATTGAPTSDAASSSPPAASQGSSAPTPVMASRILSPTELRPSLNRVFLDSLQTGTLAAPDRTYLASLVASRTGLSQQESEKRVDEAFEQAKGAEVKVRAAADKARKVTALAAFLAAATLAIGCAAACAAAGLGGRHRDEQTEIRLFGTKYFW